MPPGFFRKAALEKLSTPEKLDQLIKITGPKAWIALITIALVMGSGIAWGFLGRVKTKVNASGILLGGDVFDVVSTAQGKLLKLDVAVGDSIFEGEIIAEVDQPEISQEVEKAKAAITELQIELNQLLAYSNKDQKLQKRLSEQEKRSIHMQIESSRKKIGFMTRQLDIERGLLEKGLITRPKVVQREQEIEVVNNKIATLEAQLEQIPNESLDITFNREKEKIVLRQRISQAQQQIEHMEERLQINTQLKSAHAGEVIELLITSGEMVNPGTPLFKLKGKTDGKNNLRGILYVASKDGKMIREGMEALVVPSTVKPQEFGFMNAEVTYISEFPVTQQGIMTSMQNDQLAKRLLMLGAPFEVHVNFQPDTAAYSGYKWTSAKGPEVEVNTGTSCTGKITVKQDAPITLVIPALKKFFNIY